MCMANPKYTLFFPIHGNYLVLVRTHSAESFSIIQVYNIFFTFISKKKTFFFSLDPNKNFYIRKIHCIHYNVRVLFFVYSPFLSTGLPSPNVVLFIPLRALYLLSGNLLIYSESTREQIWNSAKVNPRILFILTFYTYIIYIFMYYYYYYLYCTPKSAS